MAAKISVFLFCIDAIIYLLLHNLYDCTFNVLGFKLENFEYSLKVFISSLIDFDGLKRMFCHLHTHYVSNYD